MSNSLHSKVTLNQDETTHFTPSTQGSICFILVLMFYFSTPCLCSSLEVRVYIFILTIVTWRTHFYYCREKMEVYSGNDFLKYTKKSTWTKRNQFMKIKHIWYLPFWLILEVFVVNFTFCLNQKGKQTYH